jgi:putative membrane protein
MTALASMKAVALTLLLSSTHVHALLTPHRHAQAVNKNLKSSTTSLSASPLWNEANSYDPIGLSNCFDGSPDCKTSLSVSPSSSVALFSVASFASLTSLGQPAQAQDLPIDYSTLASSSQVVSAAGPVASALVAYAHYASLLLIVICLMIERLTVSTSMTEDEEKRVSIADTCYLFASIGLFVSGYYRATEFGKGWDFYSHEPLFWVKLALAGVVGATSLFPTIIFTKRSINYLNNKTFGPSMSPALVKRVTTLINAQLLAVLTIPLVATLMARGVWYWNEFPWQAGAAMFFLPWAGLTFKYTKEALSWQEDDLATE